MSLLGWTAPNGAKVIRCRSEGLYSNDRRWDFVVHFDRPPNDLGYSSHIYMADGTGAGLYNNPPLTPPSEGLLGWTTPNGAKVVACVRRTDGSYHRNPWSVTFDRAPDAHGGQLHGWFYNNDGVGVVKPRLSPPVTLDLTKPLQLSDGHPVELLTDKALGQYPVVIITSSGNLLRCNKRGVIVDDTRKLENVA